MPTLKTPFATETVIEAGVPTGHSSLPEPTVGLSYNENRKQYGVPVPPKRLPLESISLPWYAKIRGAPVAANAI